MTFTSFQLCFIFEGVVSAAQCVSPASGGNGSRRVRDRAAVSHVVARILFLTVWGLYVIVPMAVLVSKAAIAPKAAALKPRVEKAPPKSTSKEHLLPAHRKKLHSYLEKVSAGEREIGRYFSFAQISTNSASRICN